MSEQEILTKLAELKAEALKLDLHLFAVLQDKTALEVEAIAGNIIWNDVDDAKAEACEELDFDSEEYEAIVVVCKA